jgi:hypothetical protein
MRQRWQFFKDCRAAIRRFKTLARDSGFGQLPLRYKYVRYGGRAFLQVTCDGGFPDEETYDVLTDIMREVFKDGWCQAIGAND